jgi:hypothetical protein
MDIRYKNKKLRLWAASSFKIKHFYLPFTYRSNSYIKSIKKYLHSDWFLHNLFISLSNEIHSIIFKTIIKFKLYCIHIWSFHSNSPHFSY